MKKLLLPTKIFFVLFFLLFNHTLLAQKTEISGMITDSLSLKPIEGVVVKVLDDKKIIVFGTTNNSGMYKLTFESTTPNVAVSFQHMIYKSKTKNISNKTQKLNASLSSKMISLREVTVKAPVVLVKKDTLSFNVASFKSASDRSIEDVIKKLPGMEVSSDGKIAYQGKDISKFNIEGLDMLGGKYSLASKNVQAKDVSRVEMIGNYQEIKQLQGKEYSDKVALNLKLNKEAKMRLLGTMELGGGDRGDEMLYSGELTGMTFAKNAQFIGTLKANNFGEPLANEVVDHFGDNSISNVADKLISNDLSTPAPLSYDRYRQKNDLLTSLNTVLKLSENKTLRVNLDYSRNQNNFQYETTSNYFLNNATVNVIEKQTPEFLSNSINATLDYLINSPRLFLDNNTFFSLNDVDNHFGLTTNGDQIQQQKTSHLAGLKNNFSFLKKTNKTQYNFNSSINYSHLPDNRLTFKGVPGITGDYYQLSRGESFFTKEAVSFGYDLNKISKLSMVADVRMDYDKVYTQLQRNDSATLNQNDGYKIVSSIWPEYRLLSADQRYGFTVGMPLNIYNLGFKNRINSGADFYFNRLFFNSWVNAHYIFSAFTKLEMNTGINNSIGDISDFIINPIQTSYQNQSAKTGILAMSRSFSSSMNMEYKNPLQLFFANGSVSYGNVKRNILNSQTISTGNSTIGINSSGVANENISQNITISGSISKTISTISSTTLTLNSSYSNSAGSQIRQGIETDVYGNSVSVSSEVHTQIIKRLELNYQMNYSLSSQNANNLNATYHQQSHDLKLSYNPIDAIVINGSMNFTRSEIVPKSYKNMQFLDVGVRYKFKKFETGLKMNNLLNTKQYSYTVISNLDRFSYNYRLNAREVVASCKFNL